MADPFEFSIFSYTDFRKCLHDYYLQRKRFEKKFSHRFIQEFIGVKSTGWFADVIKGRTNMPGAFVAKLSKLMKLTPSAANYFEQMVQFGQADSHEERIRHFHKMMTFREVRADVIGMDRIEFYSKWYHGAIREILFFFPFRGNYTELANKLNPTIRPTEARESVALLQRLGMVEPNDIGGFKSIEAIFIKDSTFPSIVLANFLKTNMELAIEALERFPKTERDVSALTVSLSDQAFSQVKEDIRALRKKILAMTEIDLAPTKVYQCNFQFFPISQ